MLHDIVGDFTEPVIKTGTRILTHIVNDKNIWGSGAVLAISNKWSGPETKYKKWYEQGYYEWKNNKYPFKQGQCQLVNVDKDLYVCNIIGQSNIGHYHGLPAVRYGALEEALLRLKYELIPKLDNKNVTIHSCYMGAGRAGGDINKVREILERVFPEVDMYLYEYDGEFK